MDQMMRPRRSALYIPGSKPRAIEKAAGLAADVLLLDLEDSVVPGEKDAARQTVADAVKAKGFGGREVVVRINETTTPWGEDDLIAVAEAGPDAVLLPKVEGQAAIVAARAVLAAAGAPEMPIWAMIETPGGVLTAADTARAPGMGCLVAGTNDLVADLRTQPGADRAEISTALQMIVLAARAAGIAALDGVYNAYKDTDGLAQESRQGRALGYDGKTLIHPGQVPVANEIFGPDAAALGLAERQVAAFAEAEAAGQGVAVLDGKIVENLHVAAAKRLLAQKAAIDALAKEIAQ